MITLNLLYTKFEEMECLQGDTLPEFRIAVSGADDLSGCTMKAIIESEYGTIVEKDCTLSANNAFTVVLTNTETAKLEGICRLHFCMTDSGGLKYRKLAGILKVRPAEQGE